MRLLPRRELCGRGCATESCVVEAKRDRDYDRKITIQILREDDGSDGTATTGQQRRDSSEETNSGEETVAKLV